MRLGARPFNLADDRKNIRGEGVRLGALRDRAVSAGLGEVARVSELHAMGLTGRQG